MEIEVDFNQVPLTALKSSTRAKLASMLDMRMIVRLTTDGLWRDWRGLAELAGYDYSDIVRLLRNKSSPTEEILMHWEKQKSEKSVVTIQNLICNLEKLTRYDVLDDLMEDHLIRDAKFYIEQRNNSVESSEIIPSLSCPEPEYKDPLTIHDRPLAVQKYNAYVCSTGSDKEFVKELIDYVEGQLKMKLYIKDRDLLIGVFEHEAAITLIKERCDKMLVVLSPDFLKNKMLAFETMLAQAVSLEESRRKLIPIIYKPCNLPPAFRYIAKLDYSANSFGCFWGRLKDALEDTSTKSSTSLLSVPNSNANAAYSSDEEANDTSTSDYYSSSPNLRSAVGKESKEEELERANSFSELEKGDQKSEERVRAGIFLTPQLGKKSNGGKSSIFRLFKRKGKGKQTDR